MYELIASQEFTDWTENLRDRNAVEAIATRLVRIQTGLLGDVKSVGGGISEARIYVGKGYRLYFTIQDNELVLLLCGGNKSNKKQQQADIKNAAEILKVMTEEE